MRGQCATGKIQRNNYHHGSCGPSLTDKTSSVSLIVTHGTHRNVKKSLNEKQPLWVQLKAVRSMSWYRLVLIKPYSCHGRKHRCKDVSDSVPSSFDIREHFAYNIASLTGIVINCKVYSSCNDRSNH